MGRVKDFKERRKKGPGKKTKKQADPELMGAYQQKSEVGGGRVKKKKVGGSIKQRARKRAALKNVTKELVDDKTDAYKLKKGKPSKRSGEEKMESVGFLPDDLEEEKLPAVFTDENSVWLKPKNKKGKKKKEKPGNLSHGQNLTSGGSNGDSSIDEEGGCFVCL